MTRPRVAAAERRSYGWAERVDRPSELACAVARREDGPRASWTLAETRPARLAGLVESIWYFEGPIPHPCERHLPNGLVQLVVQLDAPFHFVRGGVRERCPPVCFAGLQTAPTAIEAPAPRSRVLGVRLTPAGAYMVAGSPLSAASERVVDLGDLVGRAASELAERCDAPCSPEGRMRAAARWIFERIARATRLDPRIAWAAGRIEATYGAVAIADLAQATGLSRKRLIAAFREQIGLPPKLYARVVRFRRGLGLLHRGAGSLAQIALAAGYYDQPHMNLELRALGGLAPGDFLTARRYSATTVVD